MRISVLAIFSVLAACGTTPTDPDAVWSSDVTQLTLHQSGGLPSPNPTAECPGQETGYTLLVAGRSLSGFLCENESTPPYALVRRTASRPLSAAEFDALVVKLQALRIVHTDECHGADKPTIEVTVKTGADTIEYGDSFYACSDHRTLIDTQTLDAADAALRQLVFPRQ